MRKLRNYSKYIFVFSLLLLVLSGCKKEAKDNTSTTNGKVEAKVVRVIDGDTLVVAIPKTTFNDGQATLKNLKYTVRLIGVDTPESKENRRARLQAKEMGTTVRVIVHLGKRAKEFTETLLLEKKKGRKKIYKTVYLEFDKEPQDHYGRLLAYVWLPDGRMLNEILICNGFAQPLVVKPNTKYADRFQKCYEKALKEKRGLWRKGR
jgi:micrococcal nuclease